MRARSSYVDGPAAIAVPCNQSYRPPPQLPPLLPASRCQAHLPLSPISIATPLVTLGFTRRTMTDIVMQQPHNVNHGPSDKERKYDRQLRLWAASGQNALESAHILLINSGCGTVGIEILKNLVLPGLYHFPAIIPTPHWDSQSDSPVRCRPLYHRRRCGGQRSGPWGQLLPG